uniref:Uncharacterized protein n=1 Tax=Bionectria ochroleuca TaxID=29856 RepID=A0A8H7TMS8_BIOOC
MFAFKMNSTIKYIPFKSTQDGRYDLSPFRVRTDGEVYTEKKRVKKEVTMLSAGSGNNTGADDDAASIAPGQNGGPKGMSLQRWLHPAQMKDLGGGAGQGRPELHRGGQGQADAAGEDQGGAVDLHQGGARLAQPVRPGPGGAGL